MKPQRTRSKAAFEAACRLIPGGVNSPARAFGGVGGQPPFVARGEGPYLFDIDGNRYLDHVGSWGPLILGHCHPRVVRAVEDALHQGASFGAPTERETLFAEIITRAMPRQAAPRTISGPRGRSVVISTARNPPVIARACGRANSWPINSCGKLLFRVLRVTSKPAANEIKNAGTWLTRPSPIVKCV